MNIIQDLLILFKLNDSPYSVKKRKKQVFTKENIIKFIKKSIFFIPTFIFFIITILLTAPLIKTDTNEQVPFYLYILIYLIFYIYTIMPINILILLIKKIIARIKNKKHIVDLQNEISIKMETYEQLIQIVHHTTDETAFFQALDESIQILSDLLKYKEDFNFAASPSKDLMYLTENRYSLIEHFKRKNFNTDVFAKKCNNYVAQTDIKMATSNPITNIKVTDVNKNSTLDISTHSKNTPCAMSMITPANSTLQNLHNEVEVSIKEEPFMVNKTIKSSKYRNKPNETIDFIKPEQFMDNDILTTIDYVDEHDEYFSSRIIIPGVHIHFISVARDIIHRNYIDELLIKRAFNLSYEDYEIILTQLEEANIIDNEKNILMTSENLEYFFDIYHPDIFRCSYTTFDKDIFICLGELIIEHGVEYAKNCFSSIEELLDYLSILEKLKVIQFNNENYTITCTLEEFHHICKGVPEYYSKSIPITDSNKSLSNTDYDLLSGIEFEQFCANILLQNGYKNVIITKASGDHGIDILADKDEISYAIQCKCYSSNVGNTSVQQALTGKKLYGKDIAVVLTNNYFTQQATEEALSLGVKLWNRDKLNEMINNCHPT